MIFFNDEGIENGGLVFDGGMIDGRPTNGGSLTFDRYRQDQTVQMTSVEDGERRKAALIVNDRPDRPMDFAAATRIRAMPPGPARADAMREAGYGGVQRAYLGRTEAKDSRLDLSDAQGRTRLRLQVDAAGQARIAFLDTDGRVTRTIAAR